MIINNNKNSLNDRKAVIKNINNIKNDNGNHDNDTKIKNNRNNKYNAIIRLRYTNLC